MIMDNPLGDGLLQYTCVDFQSYSRGYPFEHFELLHGEDFQTSLCSNFDGHEDVASPE
jgi:hypothetical protein